jgi:hypothetical protein
MDALLQARHNPELSTAGPRTSTAKKQKIRSNKRSAIIKEIRENLEKEKSGTVPCYNHYIVFLRATEVRSA